eukprot:517548-Rhodomonas_salina.1
MSFCAPPARNVISFRTAVAALVGLLHQRFKIVWLTWCRGVPEPTSDTFLQVQPPSVSWKALVQRREVEEFLLPSLLVATRRIP